MKSLTLVQSSTAQCRSGALRDTQPLLGPLLLRVPKKGWVDKSHYYLSGLNTQPINSQKKYRFFKV